MKLLERSPQPGVQPNTGGVPPDADLIIKEARRRHRRRLAAVGASIGLVGVAVATAIAVSSSSNPHKPPTQLPRLTQKGVTAKPTVAPSLATCQAAQLAARFRGSQGTAGNWFSAFWFANSGTSPCALRSDVTVVLSNGYGETRTATAPLATPILLSAHGTMPPLGRDPFTDQSLASLTLSWPTIPNVVLRLGGTGTQCPQSLFQAESAEITFAGTGTVTVGQLSNSEPEGQSVPPICGPEVQVGAVAPLVASNLP